MGGGDGDYGDYADQTKNEWQNACASGSANNFYVYGGTTYEDFIGSACNSQEHGAQHAIPGGIMTGCQSSIAGYEGVFDLGGNVWEWDSSCFLEDQADIDYCHMRGGSFRYMANSTGCDQDDGGAFRYFAFNDLGFRCCAEAN